MMIMTLRKKFPIFKSNPFVATFFGMSLATLVLAIILSTSVYLFSGVSRVKAEEPKWIPPTGTSIMEVHIANNGMVLLKGAQVLSVSGPVIVVGTSWNEAKLQWTIRTDETYYNSRHFGTSFLDSKGNKLSIEDVRVGGSIGVSGVFEIDNIKPTVKAEIIKIAN